MAGSNTENLTLINAVLTAAPILVLFHRGLFGSQTVLLLPEALCSTLILKADRTRFGSKAPARDTGTL